MNWIDSRVTSTQPKDHLWRKDFKVYQIFNYEENIQFFTKSKYSINKKIYTLMILSPTLSAPERSAGPSNVILLM